MNKKNNWDEIARVFIQIRVCLKRSLGRSEGRGTGRGRVGIQEQTVEGNGPKWRPVVRQRCKRETAARRSEETSHWMVLI